MHLSTAIALAKVATLVVARPMRILSTRDVTTFPAGLSWDIVLNKGEDGKGNVKPTSGQPVQVIDVDLVDNSKETIEDLKSTMKVICYFSAGSKEPNRPDSGDFKEGDWKNPVIGWDGEYWLDVKSSSVHDIMKKRIDLAVDKGCDAVDPDNVDGYEKDNNDGFNYDISAYAEYIKLLADYATHHPVRPIAIGLKNAISLFQQHRDVIETVQFAVNEECRAHNECDTYKLFTDKNKAVFNVEYDSKTRSCGPQNNVPLSTVNKDGTSLNNLGGVCAALGGNASQPPATPTSTANPTGSRNTAGPSTITLPTGSPTRAASHPTPTNSQGEGKDGDDSNDDGDNGDNGDDVDESDEQAEGTTTHTGGLPTSHPGLGHGKGHGWHSRGSLISSATPTPSAE